MGSIFHLLGGREEGRGERGKGREGRGEGEGGGEEGKGVGRWRVNNISTCGSRIQ